MGSVVTAADTGAPASRADKRAVAWLSEVFVSWQGEGSRAGQRHLFVRFAGCNIRCSWCDTPDSLVKVPRCEIDYPSGVHETVENPIPLARVAAIVARAIAEDPSITMIAITGGEPMVQSAFLSRWLTDAPPARPCLLETNAMFAGALPSVLGGIAVVSADVKLPSNTGEGDLWDEHRAFLEACRGTEVYVKMPVDERTDAGEVARAADVASAVPGATLYVQPVTDPATNAWCIGSARLDELAAVAAARVRDTRVLPQIHKLVGIR